MFVGIRRTPDRIIVADRAALFVWLFTAAAVVGFGGSLVATARAQIGTGRWIGTALVALAFAASALFAVLGSRLRTTRTVFDAARGAAQFQRRRLFRVEHRIVPLGDIADVVLRERKDGDGDLLRGIHVVTRKGERIDVIGTDQTDGDRFPPLADSIRELISRPTPPPSPPRA